MFLLRESLWWVAASGAIGYFCGWGKGRAGLGLLLGLLLGPIGCLIIMLVPAAAPSARKNAGEGRASMGGSEGEGSCPRCGRAVPARARACAHCGNVLMPIRYAVETGDPRI